MAAALRRNANYAGRLLAAWFADAERFLWQIVIVASNGSGALL